MSGEYSGLSADRFLGVEEAHKKYSLGTRDSLFAPEVDRQLVQAGIAKIVMPVSVSDFETLLAGYETCIHETPDLLEQTRHAVDARFGNQAGHERKERKISRTTELQIQDPKNIMHFNEYARRRWEAEFTNVPRVFKNFLENGYEIHNALIKVAREQFQALDETHPGILASHFPGNEGTTHASHSYTRLGIYDGYEADHEATEVAKPHYDISGSTIHGYASAPGFWGASDGVSGERTYYDTPEGEAYFFLGRGYEKLYREAARMKALYHGVNRIVPPDVAEVPKRSVVVHFTDSPFIDYGVMPEDTVPYLAQEDTGNDATYIELGNTA